MFLKCCQTCLSNREWTLFFRVCTTVNWSGTKWIESVETQHYGELTSRWWPQPVSLQHLSRAPRRMCLHSSAALCEHGSPAPWTDTEWPAEMHDDVIKWKHFPRYWPFVQGIPAQRPVTRSFNVFFDLRLNKRLSKQSGGWWFETLPCPLWRHCNGKATGMYLWGYP